MKLIVLFIVAGILSVGCTSYQYTSLKSNLKKSEDSDQYYYSDANSTISFNFYGNNFPVHIFIENTSDKDLFVDLNKTLFLKNDEILSNAIPNSKTKISAAFSASGSNIDFYGNYSESFASGNIHGTATTKHYSRMLYIPKGKKVRMTYHPFSAPYDKEIRHKSNYTTPISEDGMENAKMFIYPVYDQPQYAVQFFIIPGSSDAKGYPVTCNFYPNVVLTTTVSPERFELANPNTYYIRKY